MATYCIKRFYQNPRITTEIIKTGVTLAEAKIHCNDPQTSHKTATGPEARARLEARGPWFDGFSAE